MKNKGSSYIKSALIIILLIVGFQSKADHIIGSDMTYTCGDTAGLYEITFNFYRDCNGCYVLGQSPKCGTNENCASSSTAPTNLTVLCIDNTNPSTVGSIAMTRQSIEDITPTCLTALSRCDQPCNGTFPHGIEKHTFTGTVDLRNSISSGCCKFEINVRLYVRNVGITTGQSQAGFFTSCEIDACQAPCNSSPALTNDPVAILCCNQPYSFNNGALDTTDFDSISYEFAPAYANRNQICNYSGNRTYQDPVTTYYPGSLSWPYTNPNSSPPIGTYLSPTTGDLIFTPVSCNEVAVVVIQMVEWRKDSTGTYKQIGVTRRDMQFIVMTCPDNNPPIVNGPYAYNVCAGSQLCFNITTNDVVFTPPPPASAPAPDTVELTWNKGIPGATFSIVNPTGRLQTGQFCWTPGLDQASDLPYTFTATARDNACPLNAVTVRSFRVTVKHRALAERDVDTLPCGEYTFESNPVDGFRGTPSYRWQILDSNLNIVFSKRMAYFKSNGSFLSLNKMDTILFRQGGKYIIQHTINNTPQNCPTTYYDTLVVPDLLVADLSLGKDTFICAGTTLRLEPYLSNGVPSFTYRWSTMGVTDDGDFLTNTSSNPGDTLTYFDLTVPTVQKDTAVAIIITDAIGCSTEDTVQVFLKANPKVVMPADMRICTYDSALVVPNYDTAYWIDPILGDTLVQGDTLWKEWYLNGSPTFFSTNDSNVVNIRGEYVVRVYDSLGCADTDTMMLFVNDTVVADAGLDRTLCFNDTIFLDANGLDTVGNGVSGFYRWRDITLGEPGTLLSPNSGINETYDIEAQNDVDYRLDLYVTEGGVQCRDSAFVSVFVNPLPTVRLCNDYDICCDYGNISLGFCVQEPAGNPAEGTWTVPSRPTWESSNTFYTDSACEATKQFSPNQAVNTRAIYTYTDPLTQCVNSDSVNIKVNPLPRIILKEANYCQDINEFQLKADLVTSPAAFLGAPTWKCLECNGNDFENDLLVDKGVAGASDYWMNISEANYTLLNADVDTVVLEFEYVDQNGCRSKDTTEFRIYRVPKVLFASMRDLCYDEGEISLDDLTNINLEGGTWTVEAVGGFRTPADLGGITGDTINTLNSVEYSGAGPNAWTIRYYHDLTGCPAENDTTLIINPLPDISITPLDNDRVCEVDANETFTVTPSGGTWTSSDPAALVGGNTFSPSTATVKGSLIWFTYSYTNPATGCSSKDSISAQVDPQPTLTLPTDSRFCREQGQMMTSVVYNEIDGTNYDELTWFNFDTEVSLSAIDLKTASYTHQVQTADTFRIIVGASGLGACNDIEEFFDVIIDPIPQASILPTVPNGCNPVTSDFVVDITNQVDSLTATYTWDLGSGNTSSDRIPSGTYDTDGTQNISLILTSDQGCDTTINTSVDVYPIPVAGFVPNPNNYTTAALPLFQFTNQSTVANVLGANIVSNSWDFDDPNVLDDTSNLVDPSHFYGSDTASYNVTLTVTTNHGCTDQITYPVVVGPDLIVYIPNAFTPNNAGVPENEGFKPIISGEKSMELIIFNRWGEIIFTSVTNGEEWDGTFQGAPAQQDVYAYQLKVVALNDKEYMYSGTITLIR